MGEKSELGSIRLDEQKVARCAAKGQIFWANFRDSDQYSPLLLEQIDDLCQKYGPNVEVRFFGNAFDADNLRYLPSVQNLSVDCLNEIKNEDQMAALSQLRRLSFQVREFNRPEFLSTLNLSNLEVLTLGGTRRANLDLKSLAKAQCLRKFTVEGHRRGIENLAQLLSLEQLILWAQPKAQSLAFVSEVPALRHLKLIRGGRETLDDVRHETLESLSVAWVNGLRDLGPIRRFPRLKGLHVADQIRLRSIDLTGAGIQFLGFVNCKNLAEIGGLDEAMELEQFEAVQPLGLRWAELRDRRWPASLRVLRLWSPSMKWNKSARAMHDARGYKELGEWTQSDVYEVVGDGI